MPPAHHGKYPAATAAFVPAGALSMAGAGYGPVTVVPHIIHASRAPSQMVSCVNRYDARGRTLVYYFSLVGPDEAFEKSLSSIQPGRSHRANETSQQQ